MAITPVAGEVLLELTNDGRSAATPPITFPNFNTTENFSWCVWVYPLGKRGDPSIAITDLTGTDGSKIVIGHNGFSWAYIIRAASVAQDTIYFEDVVYNRWALFCFTKEGPNITLCYGLEDPDNPSAPVVPRVVISTTSSQAFNFYYFLVRCGASYYTTCFKYWNGVLNIPNMVQQCNRYDAQTGGITGAPVPIWISTLRTPGDLSNIVNPYTGPNWDAGHAFNLISPLDSLKMVSDPAVLASTPCPTWVYPIIPTAASNFNPGTSPLVSTVYDSPDFWEMQDRGSVSPKDADIQSIEYYAYPHATTSGYGASDSWGLYQDENGVKVESVRSNPANRLEQDTGVVIPVGIKASTMYAWKYGAQFTWMPHIPQGPTANQQASNLHLFVIYTGIPTGIAGLPVENMSGLFAINKIGPRHDRYNRGTILKIPQPTIKTALIGK